MDNDLIKTSKFLSLVLRHRPNRIGITLDEAGWVDVDALLAACEAHNRPIARETLHRVVATNDKRRFTIRDGRIRANQGHSVPVDLDLTPHRPPRLLYHGTIERHMLSIE